MVSYESDVVFVFGRDSDLKVKKRVTGPAQMERSSIMQTGGAWLFLFEDIDMIDNGVFDVGEKGSFSIIRSCFCLAKQNGQRR